MAEQIQKKVPDRDSVEGLAEEDAAAQEQTLAAATEKGEKLKGEMDELLDEIDEVLEVNAEDFVRSYVQRGGQ